MSVSHPARGAPSPPAAASPDLPATLAADTVALSPDGQAVANGLAADAYAGLVTRAIAFALDVAIVESVAALVGVTVGLGLSILAIPSQLETAVAAILGVVWVVWSLGYFVFFWSTTGQTPGNRVMGIRVVDAKRRGPLKPRRAAVRFGGLCLAAIPLLAGFLMMLWDDRARCLQDRIARTVVIYTQAKAPAKSAVGRDLTSRSRSA